MCPVCQSAPFVKVKLAPDGKELRSPVAKQGGQNPEWNWFCVLPSEGQESLGFEVLDKRKDRSEALIGRATERIEDLEAEWRGDLELRDDMEQMKGKLDVSIECQVLGKSCVLENPAFWVFSKTLT